MSVHHVSKASFIEDFRSFIEGAALSCCENIILGELNLHLDIHDSLCQYNFTQIDSPTYIHGHILNVICVRDTLSQAVCPKVTGGGGGVCQTILPSYLCPRYLSRHPANSGRLVHR